MVYVALLRGINVGGKTMVSMAELKLCFEKLGFTNVQTYINSGNVIFESPEKDIRNLENTIEQTLETTFSNSIKVVVKSQTQMKQITEDIPKSWANNNDLKCNVIFLRYTVDSADILKDLKAKPGIEELTYKPGVLYWAANTSDLTKSEMVKLSRSKLYQEMTVRNLNTTRKVYDLMLGS